MTDDQERRSQSRRTASAAIGTVVILMAAVAPAGRAQATGALSISRPGVAAGAELVAAREAVWRAWFAGDTAQLLQLLPAGLAAGEGNAWEDRAQTIKEAVEFARSGGRLVDLQFAETDISILADVAVVRSRVTLTTEQDGRRARAVYLATEVFAKQNGRWVNPFWHLTRVE